MATFQKYYEWSRMSETFGRVKLHFIYYFCFIFDFIHLINSVVCKTVCSNYIRRRGRILKLEPSSCSFELLRSVVAFKVYFDEAICIVCLSYFFVLQDDKNSHRRSMPQSLALYPIRSKLMSENLYDAVKLFIISLSEKESKFNEALRAYNC